MSLRFALKLISIVAYSNINPDDFSPSKLFHL
jgi:hypothetical protein